MVVVITNRDYYVSSCSVKFVKLVKKFLSLKVLNWYCLTNTNYNSFKSLSFKLSYAQDATLSYSPINFKIKIIVSVPICEALLERHV